MEQYELTLGLPHTNYLGLGEHLLMMHAGHFQWTSIARAIGRPLSQLRTIDGGKVYATFYFIEMAIPDAAALERFDLDERLRFGVWLRGFKGIAVEGQLLFDRTDRLPPLEGFEACPDALRAAHPFIRFANIFITPESGNSRLRVAPPANADFSTLPVLPIEENPYHLTKEAETTGSLGLLDGWERIDGGRSSIHARQLDPDRDTNGAGLVYFASYFAFMNTAERSAMLDSAGRRFSPGEISSRSTGRRRVAYYGNASVDDTIVTDVSLFGRAGEPETIGYRYVIRRSEDGAVICRSEAIKVLVR